MVIYRPLDGPDAGYYMFHNGRSVVHASLDVLPEDMDYVRVFVMIFITVQY